MLLTLVIVFKCLQVNRDTSSGRQSIAAWTAISLTATMTMERSGSARLRPRMLVICLAAGRSSRGSRIHTWLTSSRVMTEQIDSHGLTWSVLMRSTRKSRLRRSRTLHRMVRSYIGRCSTYQHIALNLNIDSSSHRLQIFANRPIASLVNPHAA